MAECAKRNLLDEIYYNEEALNDLEWEEDALLKDIEEERSQILQELEALSSRKESLDTEGVRKRRQSAIQGSFISGSGLSDSVLSFGRAVGSKLVNVVFENRGFLIIGLAIGVFFLAILTLKDVTAVVSFSAVRKSNCFDYYHVPGQIQFDETMSKEGKGWDEERSVFECNYKGKYLFSWIASIDHFYPAKISLVKNGKKVADSLLNLKESNVVVHNSVVISLDVGDRVMLNVMEVSRYSNRNNCYASFTGYRIK